MTEEGNLSTPIKTQSTNTSSGLTAYEKGQQGVDLSKEQARARGETIIGEEISIKLDSGKTTRADILVEKLGGGLKVIECKNDPCANLTPNQRQGQVELPEKGGVFTGRNAEESGLPTGQNTGPIEYQVDRHNEDGFK